MESAVVEGLSIPPFQFFCYKNFVTGLVKVKVSNFESILKSKHTYPVQKLKLVLKLQGSTLYLEGDKAKTAKTQLGLFTLEKATLQVPTEKAVEMQDCQATRQQTQSADDKRTSSFGRLLNRMIGSKSPK